jgi:hypothetical protein
MLLAYQIETDLEKGVKVKGLGTIPKFHDEKAKRLLREGKFPVGTIRSWQIGDAIKTDDKNWTLIEIPDDIHAIGKRLQDLILSIHRNNDPIKGKLVVEHVLHKYFDERELISGEYIRTDMYGNFLGWDFDNGLYKDWVYRWIDKKEDSFISMKTLQQIEEDLKQYKELSRTGGGLKKEDQLIYLGLMKRIKEIPEEYIPFFLMGSNIKTLVRLMSKFKDNFIINTALTLNLEENLKKYLDNFHQEIIQEEGNRIIDEANTKIDASPHEFYEKIIKQLKKEKDKIDYSQDSFITNIENDILKLSISSALELRYEKLLGLKLEHSSSLFWNEETIPALQNFELFATEVPVGHIINNPYLKTLTNKDYDGKYGGDGYAFYMSNLKSITFSEKALNSSNLRGSLKVPDEFNSVLAHEAGHAVAEKLREIKNLDFKIFAKWCGWDWRIFRLETKTKSGRVKIYNEKASVGDEDVPRTGENKHVPLLTKYSHKSPNEAFAEYYSFYYLNKDKLDKWLETGDSKDLILKGKNTLKTKKEIELERELIKITTVKKVKKAIKDEKGRIVSFEESSRPLTEGEVEQKINRRAKGFLVYRNKDIYIEDIIQNYVPLKIMKEKIFENEKLIKALLDLGVNVYSLRSKEEI